MKPKKKRAIFQTEMLTKPHLGIYTVTTYYSDGTQSSTQVPKAQIILPKDIDTIKVP